MILFSITPYVRGNLRAIFLDLETTGLDATRHTVIDIALCCVDMTTYQRQASYQSLVAVDRAAWDYADAKSLVIHGYTWDELQTGQTLEQVASDLIDFFQTHDINRNTAIFICQNPSFDRAFFTQIISIAIQEQLRWPYHWLDLASMFWALQVKHFQYNNQPLPSNFSLSKNAIAAHYHLPPEDDIHRASYAGI
jgi:oligoribonuclease